MYGAQIVEEAPVGELFKEPLDPYTQGLLRSIPRIDLAATKRQKLEPSAAPCPRCAAPRSPLPVRAALLAGQPMHFEQTPTLERSRPGHKVAASCTRGGHPWLSRSCASRTSRSTPHPRRPAPREVARVHAVDDVLVRHPAGETLGLVGESAAASRRRPDHLAADRADAGEVSSRAELTTLDKRSLRALRRDADHLQDPYASLNPADDGRLDHRRRRW